MGAASSLVLPHQQQAAYAVKDRNEALCGTGFYTNIWQYKCTDLGDIEDEGLGKEMSSSEQGAADSLMSKLGGDIEIVDKVSSSSSDKKPSSDSDAKETTTSR